MPLDLNDKSTLVQEIVGAIRHQTITWDNVDQDVRHCMASLGPNELM